MIHSGRHFLQIPGPTNVPDRVLRAMAQPTMDHRGPEFGELGRAVLRDVRAVFKTKQPVVIYPASGTGAWEAALVNTLSPGDTVLMVETGQFAALWEQMAKRLGLNVELLPTDWRHGADPNAIEDRLRRDTRETVKAVCVVHNETSTGVVSRIPLVRKALDAARHPALLLVDTISSLASIDYRMDEWGVDVTVGGSQKGLMLPPGLSFNAISEKALAASQAAKLPRSFWAWDDDAQGEQDRVFPVHAGNEPALWLARGARDAGGRGPRKRVRAPRAPRRSHAARRPRVGPRGAVPGAVGIQRVADRRADARGARCRRAAGRDFGRLRHVPRHGARAGWPARCSGSDTSATSTISRSPGLLRASRWASPSRRCRTSPAACRPPSTISPTPPRRANPSPSSVASAARIRCDCPAYRCRQLASLEPRRRDVVSSS